MAGLAKFEEAKRVTGPTRKQTYQVAVQFLGETRHVSLRCVREILSAEPQVDAIIGQTPTLAGPGAITTPVDRTPGLLATRSLISKATGNASPSQMCKSVRTRAFSGTAGRADCAILPIPVCVLP